MSTDINGLPNSTRLPPRPNKKPPVPNLLPPKPNKQPPPPPLPPKDSSRARTSVGASSLVGGGGGGSDYAYSVCSITSRRSLQPGMYSYNPCISQSCHQGTYSPCSSIIQPIDNYKHNYNPLALNHECSSVNLSSPDSLIGHRFAPLAQPRISREPRRSQLISPLPDIKGNQVLKYHEKCSSFYYRRHIEQHIERLFKYLQEREQRRLICEEGLLTRDREQQGDPSQPNQNQQPCDQPSDDTIRNLLARRETKYLRDTRQRLSTDDFQELAELGRGFIGKVYLVSKKPKNGETTKQLYAMKKLSKEQVKKQGQIAHVMAERDILAEADNEWIVKLFYSFQDNQYLYFILEYIPGGDLMGRLQTIFTLSEEDAKFYIAEISLALQFVHNMKFIHRDIKPDNILINFDGHIKLTDFGLCTGSRWTHNIDYYKDDERKAHDHYKDNDRLIQEYHDEIKDDCPTITMHLTQRQQEQWRKPRVLSCVGSPFYIAPEVLLKKLEHNVDGVAERLSDWWSVGVILYEMIYGFSPFIDLVAVQRGNYNPALDPPEDIQRRIIEFDRTLKLPTQNDGNLYLPNMPVSEEAQSLIRQLICHSEERLCRNGVKDLQKHPFFAGFDWNNIRRMNPPYIPDLKDERDTSHFPNISNEPGHLMATDSSNAMPINGFTYYGFWNQS